MVKKNLLLLPEIEPRFLVLSAYSLVSVVTIPPELFQLITIKISIFYIQAVKYNLCTTVLYLQIFIVSYLGHPLLLYVVNNK
jgi:hypothetical protein